MANVCSTDYIFTGSNKSLEEFRNTIVNAWEPNEESMLFSDVLTAFDLDLPDLKDKGSIICLGEVNDGNSNTTGSSYLSMSTSTAWIPYPEIWDAVLNKNFADVHYVFCAEEPGMQLYVNTDVDHDYFEEAYKVSITLAPKYNSADFYIGYYDSLLVELNRIFGWRCKSIKQFNRKLRKKQARMRKLGKPFCFYLHEYDCTW